MKKRLFTVLATLAISTPVFALAACGDDTPTKKPKLTHEAAVEATCTVEGHKEYWTDGNKYYSDKNGKTEVSLADLTVSKKDHSPASTYKSAGANGHYHVCTVCSNAADAVVEHAWGEWIVDSEPGETKPGSKHKECTASGCGYKTPNETIPATGKPVELTPVAEHTSTCITAGNIAYWTDGEGHYYSDEKGEHEITLADTVSPLAAHTVGEMKYDATGHWHLCAYTEEGEHVYKDAQCLSDKEGHKLGGWIIDEAPTDEETGLRHKECTVNGCGYATAQETAPALGVTIHHEYKDSTCTEEGNVECWEKGGVYYSDEECTTELADADRIIEMKDHQYASNRDETDHWKECSVCHDKIDVDGHTYTDDVKEPTCTEGGKTTHTCACGYSYDSDEKDAIGHSYGEPVWEWAEDHSAATVTFTCGNCADEQEITATVTTTTTSSTCTEKGDTTYTATAEFDGEAYTDKVIIDGELLEHAWSEDWSTDEYKHWHACTDCGTHDEEDEGWHTGGTATATDKAVCEVCGTAYGDVLPSYNGEDKLAIDSGKAKLTGSATHNGTAIEAITTGVTITFEFNVETEGEVMLVLNGTHVGDVIEGGFKIAINGEEQEELLDVASTATWYNAAKICTYKTTLQQGKNVVVFTAMEGASNVVNVYSLDVGPVVEEGEEDNLPTYVGEEALIIQPSDATITGSGNLQGSFIGGTGNNSTVVTYTFYSKVEEEVELILAIANGGNTFENAFSVKINDGEAFLMDAETSGAGQWTKLEPRTVKKMTLNANTKYTVEFSLLNGGGTLNIGYFKVAPTTAPAYAEGKTMTFGASSVTPLNGCDNQGHAAGYDGSIIGNINSAGRGVSLTLNSSDATTAHLTVHTDGDNGASVTFEVIVNGESAGQYTYSANGWTNFNFARDAGNITLVQGENTIEIKLVSGAMNFSHLILSPATGE